MHKIKIYPKTTRVGNNRVKYNVYEKLDGSNLGIGKTTDQLYIFTRNNMYFEDEWDDLSYPNLNNWLVKHKDELLTDICDNTIIFGEWMGQGKIKYRRYGDEDIHTISRFYMFGYSDFNLTEILANNEALVNIKYDSKEFAFNRTKLAYDWDTRKSIWDDIKYIKPVPHLFETDGYTLSTLEDKYYADHWYSELDNESQSEGFIVVDYKQNILKFVMNK